MIKYSSWSASAPTCFGHISAIFKESIKAEEQKLKMPIQVLIALTVIIMILKH
jgi:hypothetical protein